MTSPAPALLATRLYLSPPEVAPETEHYLLDAIRSGWIAPLGPHVDAFQDEFAHLVGAPHAVALSSGTAALHLALLAHGIGSGDEVLVSTLTFAASANPILYVGARPVFIDSEITSWNIDPDLVRETLIKSAKRGRVPRALIVVHLYGQTANMDPLLECCEEFGVVLIEDAAESLGASYGGKHAGTLGATGIFSFNGNKLVSTSGGGMLITRSSRIAAHAIKLATQAREPAPHYEHFEIGYNYRMSNLLAAVGRAQLPHVAERVRQRREHFDLYRRTIGQIPGIRLQPEATWGQHSRWLSVGTIEPATFGTDREGLRLALESDNIESRPVWKPMHLQRSFSGCSVIGGSVSELLFQDGICLPSGSSLAADQQMRVVDAIRASHRNSR